MNIDDLKEKELEEKLTPEQLEKTQELIEKIFLDNIKGYRSMIDKYLKVNKITIQDAIQEVIDKKSRLSANAREILVNVKPELLAKWFTFNPQKTN